MSFLKIDNLSYKYLHIDIFSNINLEFQNGWSGIVGQNGCGKTTLLKLIAKKLELQSGKIIGNSLVYYCDQKLDLVPFGFEEFRDDYSSQRYKLQEKLKIEDEWLYRWESLSFGEKKRIQLAVALFSDVEVLLLDEPTNHLDYSTKQIVIEALRNFKKIGLIVSHDREVLDRLSNSTIIIKNKRFYKYKTNYTNAMFEFKKELGFLFSQSEKQSKKINALQKNIQIQKEKVSKIKSRLSKKGVDKKDKSAKEKINLAILTGKDKIDSKKVNNLNTKLIHSQAEKIKLDKEYKKGIVLETPKSKNFLFPIVLKENCLKLNGQKTLFYPKVEINLGDKIAIVGDNGVGKSSFIKHLLLSIKMQDILYLPQEINEQKAKELFESIAKLSSEKKGELFTFVTRLSSNPKNLLDNITPSSGELRKLLIAKAMLEDISLIVLDEPTNHMDIDSIVALEEALKTYKGTVLFISHDIIFVENIATIIWKIENGIMESYKL